MSNDTTPTPEPGATPSQPPGGHVYGVNVPWNMYVPPPPPPPRRNLAWVGSAVAAVVAVIATAGAIGSFTRDDSATPAVATPVASTAAPTDTHRTWSWYEAHAPLTWVAGEAAWSDADRSTRQTMCDQWHLYSGDFDKMVTVLRPYEEGSVTAEQLAALIEDKCS